MDPAQIAVQHASTQAPQLIVAGDTTDGKLEETGETLDGGTGEMDGQASIKAFTAQDKPKQRRALFGPTNHEENLKFVKLEDAQTDTNEDFFPENQTQTNVKY